MSEYKNFVCALAITEAPRLQDVIDAHRRGGEITLPLASFSATVDFYTSVEPVEAKCELKELTLRNIKNVSLDSNSRQFSFEGDHQYSYESRSYNQSSTRTETSHYGVVVFWTNRSEQSSVAHLLPLN